MNYQRLFLSGIFLSLFMLSASAKTFIIGNDSTTVRTSDTDYADELEKIRMHMPDIEVGNGISFQPKNKSYKLTMRIRMQNLVDIDFNEKFEAQDIDARVKRLRLRFDGYIYTPKLTYLVQLGFSPYDMKTLPNGNNNIVRDAMIYYVPNSTWNIGFGQTKIRANRARINSSSALQFVDSFHCKLRIQSRPRFRYLRRIQSTSIRLFGFSGQSLYYYRRRQKLGKQ